MRPTEPSPGASICSTELVLGIVMNAISRSSSERSVMTPACAVLAGCSLVVALEP